MPKGIHEAEIKQSPKQDASIKTFNRLVSADLNRTLPADVFTQVLLESPIANIEKIARAFGKEIVWLKVNALSILPASPRSLDGADAESRIRGHIVYFVYIIERGYNQRTDR